MDSSASIGYRLRKLREERGFTQEGLAARAGISPAFVGRLERDEKSPGMGTLYALAAALKVPAPVLLGRRERLGRDGKDAGVLGVRDALLAVTDLPGLGPGLGEESLPAPVPALEQAVDDGWDAYWRGQFGVLASLIPPLLGTARAAERQDGTPACRPLAQAYQLAACFLVHMGDDGLAFAAARRAMEAADRGDDLLQRATLAGTASWVLLHMGKLADAAGAAAAGAALARPAEPVLRRPGSEADLAHLNVFGALWLSAAAPAAAAGDEDAVAEYMREARLAALGWAGPDTRYYRANWGRTQIAMQRTHQYAVMRQPAKALKAAARVRPEDLAAISLGAHYLDRAQACLDREDMDGVIDALLTAHRISPTWAVHQGPWRVMTSDVVRQAKRLPRKVHELAVAAGLREEDPAPRRR